VEGVEEIGALRECVYKSFTQYLKFQKNIKFIFKVNIGNGEVCSSF